MDTPKDRIGDYELVSLIGDGAQGRVYRARYAPLSDQPETASHLPVTSLAPGDLVALKVVRITGEDEKLRLKFQEQAEILRRLTHTNIVAYRDCFSWHAGEWDESQCLVMELLEGETLSDRLKNASSGLPWPQVEEIFEQCLAGLIHARERGITHRDLKPSNIFLTKDGQAKLIDFDIARRDDSGQMSTAGWKGTFDYMAPDFITINGFRGDEGSDVFSLGVCFYQALTGSLPYEPLGDTAHIGYLNRWRDNASPAPSFRPGVFRVLSNAKTFVTRALAARRDQRYPSFKAMLEEFRTIRYRRIRHKGKDEYELLAVLGRGGFGEVFKARRVSDGLLVAVKYLFSEKQSERFVKEAKILQQYPHPNLVKYVDFMVIEGTAGEKQFFLVMEFLEGMPGWTLRPRLKNEGKLEPSEAVPLFCAYLSALQFLHDNPKPIIHRDIKPGNLYAPVGQPEKGKVFDLGVARDVTGTVTVGGVPGTLDYMAPEFAEAGGDRGSPQSDLYALGLCLYEALAGKPVFDRLPTDLNSAWLAFQDRIRKPVNVGFDAPAFLQYPRLRPIILRCLAEKPEDRYRSAADMRQELETALQPPAAAPEGDGFDASELTMATLAAGQQAQPSSLSLHPAEEVTLGTRPLAPADLPGALAAINEGRGAPPSRPPEGAVPPSAGPVSRPEVTSTLFPVTFITHRRLLAAGGLAAGLLLLGFGGYHFLFSKGRAPAAVEPSRAPQSALEGERPREPQSAAAPATASAAVPPSAQPATPAAASPTAPSSLLTTHSPVSPAAAQPSSPTPPSSLLTPPSTGDSQRAAAAVAVALAGLPGSVAAAPSAADLQRLADTFLKLEATPGVKLTAAQLAPVEEAFAARYLALAQPLAKQAAEAYVAGKNDDAAAGEKSLAELAAPVPARFGREALDKLAQEVAASRQAAAAAADQAAARAKEVAAAAAQADAVLASAQKNLLYACAGDLKTLAAFTPASLGDAGVKAKWGAARAAVAALLEQALAQKDPLEQRAQRLKLVAEALAVPAADPVLAELAPGLRQNLEQQKAVSILRLVNHGDAPVHVSARELQGKVALAGGEVKEWALPVAGEMLTVSISVEGGSRFRSRIETLKLPRAGGVERGIGSLDASAAAPVPLAPAAAPSHEAAPPLAAAAPREAAPTNAPSAAARPSITAAVLSLTVSPKAATVTIDDKPAEAGQIEVTPNENHKVSASCAGYKPVEQYYKVRPGETRRIDILLEKEPKKTLFGF